MSNTEQEGTSPVKAASGLEIFADNMGKVVFSAFEKLGNELNSLTENLERQYADDEKDSETEAITAGLDKINVMGIISASTGEIPGADVAEQNDGPDRELKHSDSLDDLLDILKEDASDGESSPVGNESNDNSPNRISHIINNMRQRSISADEVSVGAATDEASQVTDEWANDDDTGYTIITLSEEEFYDYEEETSARILAERKEAAQQAKSSPVKKTVVTPVCVSALPAKTDAATPQVLSNEPSVYEAYDSDGSEKFVDLTSIESPVPLAVSVGDIVISIPSSSDSPLQDTTQKEPAEASATTAASSSTSPSKDPVTTSTGEREHLQAAREPVQSSSPVTGLRDDSPSAQLAAKVVGGGGFGTPVAATSAPVAAAKPTYASAVSAPAPAVVPAAASVPPPAPAATLKNRRQSVGEQRRTEIMGQKKFVGVDGVHCYFNLKVIFEPNKTGFEENKDLQHTKGTVLAGRYEVHDVLGTAAFSTALQCLDLAAEEDEAQWVCLKVIKNNKDFFDQSLDEIKLLQYINSCGDPDDHHVLRLIDFFYCKEHLFIVSELLKENLYEFGRFIRESDNEPYYTMPRLKRIMKQVLEALVFIHSLKLIHCDIKPENIVIKSFSRCEVKLIDFGSSCFTTDHLTTYIQSRSYRAPEVIIGHPYDSRIDIWSVGAVLAELHTGYVLFQNDSVATMLSRITGILGQFPQNVLQRGKDTGKYFSLSNIVYERDEEGSFHLIFPKKTDLAARLHLPEDPLGGLSTDEAQFVDFVRQMLHLDPAMRMSAEQALAHPWLSDADTVYVSEYIIGQNQAAADFHPPAPGGSYEYEDDVDEDEEDQSEEGEYEYEDEEDDLEAAEAEEQALEFMMNAQGGTAEAMEAYLLELQQQQMEGFSFEDSGEEDDDDDVDEESEYAI